MSESCGRKVSKEEFYRTLFQYDEEDFRGRARNAQESRMFALYRKHVKLYDLEIAQMKMLANDCNNDYRNDRLNWSKENDDFYYSESKQNSHEEDGCFNYKNYNNQDDKYKNIKKECLSKISEVNKINNKESSAYHEVSSSTTSSSFTSSSRRYSYSMNVYSPQSQFFSSNFVSYSSYVCPIKHYKSTEEYAIRSRSRHTRNEESSSSGGDDDNEYLSADEDSESMIEMKKEFLRKKKKSHVWKLKCREFNRAEGAAFLAGQGKVIESSDDEEE